MNHSETQNESERPPSSLPQSDRLSFDHILKTSIELDDVAKRNIEQLLALGSNRLAQDFKDILDAAYRAVEQNANLLSVLRHHLGTSQDE